MAGQGGPGACGAHGAPHGTGAVGDTWTADRFLVRIQDPAGRPRGTGFLADRLGTMITSHEAVDGLPQLVLHTGAGRTRVVTADAVTALPALGLALVRTERLGVEPLPVTVRDGIAPGTYVRVNAGCWRQARVLGRTPVTYTATDRSHLLDDVMELAIGTAGRDALRPGGGAAGGPVLDAATGAVVGVVGTALHCGHRATGFAVPLPPRPTAAARAGRTPQADTDRLTDLLARNAETVPAYGADLNMAGVLELAAASVAVGSDAPPGTLTDRTDRTGRIDPPDPGSPDLRSADPVSPALRSTDPGSAASGVTGPGSAGLGSAAPGPAGPVPTGRRPVVEPVELVEPVERTAPVREFAAFATGPAAVLALVGAPGSGRTTELAALAARRHRGARPAPTLWLRGADLRDDDGSVADAARRALVRAARIVAAADPAHPADLGDITPERLARIARTAGRPLLLLLDGPEEMPPALAHRLPDWTTGTAHWLRESGARLVVGCRAEYWEHAGAAFPRELLHGGPGPAADPEGTLPPCVHLGDLTEDEARLARERYGIPGPVLGEPHARHPLTLRLLSELRAAVPEAPGTPLDGDDVLAAHLDLMCLRIAVRLAAGNGLRGTAVRRLAAKVSGQVHLAARRSLGPGQGELDRASFETFFPRGTAPARLGGGTGWACAVLAEGLLVPAGDGYRFAHEELADWIQGMHLDLDEALRVLVHGPRDGRALPVPPHRIGPVVQALLLVARQHGSPRLAVRLAELVHALDADPHSWWAARLLAEVLRRVPDATPYTGVLRLLTELIVARRRERRPSPGEFGPAFWTGLALPGAGRLDLLRRLVLADAAPHDTGPPRYLDAAAELLAADPAAVQPHLMRWFDDERPLPATPHATVATAAQALLHTHRHRALDDLAERLVESPHRRAGELLAVLAEDEPSALCRAVDRWARDERPARRLAAVTYGLRAAPHTRSDADHELLRHLALDLLARPTDCTVHGAALALLVRDPHTRSRHLPRALRHFAAADPQLPPSALVPALATHTEPVLAAFRARLRRADAGEALRTLAGVTTPALAGRVAAVLQEAVEARTATAARVTARADRRRGQDPVPRVRGRGPESAPRHSPHADAGREHSAWHP
ncbi:trypsin-like peptidase domain-containing protein [Streptomyces sp. NPDC059766]|uniref:trypsin-like peptidase domain-containing protein n=1 Tax=Streptomyces sp. NPDC059766 TaxID=3346940 RepID=UPI0036558464